MARAGYPHPVSRIPASQLRDAVLDPGSFVSWDSAGLEVAADARYARELAEARARTGLDEAVLTGEGRVHGRRVAVIASEFDFLAGSIGVAAAERITAAVEHATAERLPLLASPSSGGTRMQEGTVAFLQMVKIAAAVEQHKRSHLPYLVYLRHPTTGGVFASWGSLGHVTIAEPGALIGFLGPRVYEHLYGEPFAPGVQTAENLQRHGVIDGVVPLKWLRRTLERALKVTVDPPAAPPVPSPAEPTPDVPAWESVIASRRPHRPGVGHLLGMAPPNGCCCRAPGRAMRPPRCSPSRGFTGSLRWSSASSAGSARRSDRRRCARRAAGWRWRPACGCPSSR